jgi:hypothetical protein
VLPVIDGSGPYTQLLREFCLRKMKPEALPFDEVAKSLWVLRSLLVRFPMGRIRASSNSDAAFFRRKKA